MIVLAWIRKLYKILSADASPEAIAFAVAFGLTLGFVPLSSGIGLLLLLSVAVLRVQVSTAIAFWAVGRLLRALPFVVAFFDSIGDWLLFPESAFWVWFLNLPIAPWLGFDCPAVLGGAVGGVLLGAALFVPVRLLIISYRRWLHDRVSGNRFFRWLTSFWLVKGLRFIFLGVRS